ncbi:hypothetical protein M406DRAFT_325806 [Cryphonectria parasitica EP155]|uniref:NACHT domain-containing protein n=1 Tax=Cryphonectria parasitica (strain ATCC 38755 / EP155) TaxID=660469 RepID=A0A9P4YBK0_CRYP1|nr:uncharacterized protein M406DRAFT_325806 [Cryphonectria parasitica EP155]KAF3770356.1 hypothetical protein M406DRAFT_325806 [Cryphonectria parasitica EP155]
MTVIDFGHMLFEVSRRAYRAGTPDADAESTAHDLSRATKILETSISAGMQPITSEESELLRIANSCREAAKKLGEMYEKLAVPRSGQISWSGRATKAVLVGMKRQWQRHKFDELNNVLIGCQTAMQTRILVYLYQTNKAQEAMRLEEFSTLNRSLQNFIRAVSKAKFGMDDLLLRLNDLHALQLNTRDDLHTIQLETKSSIQQDRLLASLKFDGMNQRFNHDVRDAHHDTFKWLFGENIDSTTSSDVNSRDSTLSSWSIRQRDKMLRARQETFDDFGQWLKSDSSLYWISGKAGAGKSTLMKFICQHLSHSKPTADTVVLHYFFWFNAPTSTMQRSIAGMLSTLLYQLLQHDRALVPHLIHSMPEARLEDKDSPWDWTLDELERCLHTALRSRGVKRSVCLIIDGLDEVLEADGANALLRSIRQLEKLRTVRLCVSSRPEPVFNRDLGHSRHLRLEKLTAPDRHRFVMDALQPYASRFPRDSCTEGIEWFIAQLVGKSEGVFLWTRVATQSLVRGLNDGNSIETLKQRLDATPADLYGLFASMWKRLGEDEQFYRTGAANVFRLLLCDDEKNISARLLEGRSDNIDLMTLHLSLHREESARVIQEFERPDGTTCEMILSHCVGLVDIDSQPRTKIVDACIDLALERIARSFDSISRVLLVQHCSGGLVTSRKTV